MAELVLRRGSDDHGVLMGFMEDVLDHLDPVVEILLRPEFAGLGHGSPPPGRLADAPANEKATPRPMSARPTA